MRKILSTIILLILCTCFSFGQKLNYSLNASLNYPYIANIEEDPDYSTENYYSNQGYLSEQYSEKISGKVSGSFSYQITKRLFIESGLQFNLLRFQKSTYIKGFEYPTFQDENFGDIFIIDSIGNITRPISFDLEFENSTDLGKTNILYTEIPIRIGYSFFNNKLNLKLGITSSFLVYAEVYTYNYESFFNKEVIKNTTADGFKNLVWNGNIEVEYLVYKNFGINMNYTRSLNSVYDDSASIGSPKYNIFSLGLSYSFLPNTK